MTQAVYTVDTATSLASATGSANGEVWMTRGYYATHDGGGIGRAGTMSKRYLAHALGENPCGLAL